MTDPEQPSRWPRRALAANVVALILAFVASVIWAFVLFPEISHRLSNPIVARSTVVIDFLVEIAIMCLGLVIPVAGLLLSRRGSRPGVGCGCSVAAFSVLLSLLGLLFLLGLSGMGAH